MWAFLLSMIIGTVYGFFDPILYNVFAGDLPKSHSVVEIALHNLRVDVLSLLTGGLFGFVSNFLTFSLIGGLFGARHTSIFVVVVVFAIVFGTYGTLEMAGHLCFGLVGFTFLHRMIWKKKTRLRRLNILALGSALIFVAALVEWLLGVSI
jgi:hypothetical protein